VHDDGLQRHGGVGFEVGVELLDAGRGFDQGLDTHLEGFGERAFDEQLLAGELVDDLEAAAETDDASDSGKASPGSSICTTA